MNIIESICGILYRDYLISLHTDWLVKIKCKYNHDKYYKVFIEYVYIDDNNNVTFLNDWWEGQEDFESIEYIAIDDIKEFTNHILIEKKVINNGKN